MRLIDLTNRRFGRLIVEARDPVNAKHGNGQQARWICRCDCGKSSTVVGNSLRKGATISCGCVRKETTARRNRRNGPAHPSERNIWHGIKRRCYNTRYHDYPYYGGRGIVMCDAWRNSFDVFLRDMGPKPFPSASIDRINNAGIYEPANCRWADRSTQSRNRRPATVECPHCHERFPYHAARRRKHPITH